jgi:hypothetical protein
MHCAQPRTVPAAAVAYDVPMAAPFELAAADLIRFRRLLDVALAGVVLP